MGHLTSLPPELLLAVANYIKAQGASLAPFAASSKRCQASVESITFRSLAVPQSHFDYFSRVINKTRFIALRTLRFSIDITGENNTGLDANAGNAEAVDACSRELTHILKNLLLVLHEKSTDAETHPGLSLELTGRCIPFPRYMKTWGQIGSDRLKKHGWVKLVIEQLPAELKAPVVRAFDCSKEELSWNVWPASWPALLGRFPNLVEAHLKPSDCERKDSHCRREARDAFASSLHSLPPTLKHLTLDYLSYPPANEFYNPPNLTNPRTGYDLFSHDLGILSQQLIRLDVHNATIDLVEFFRANKPDSTWNHLEALSFIRPQIASADGSWYFTLDPRMTMQEYEEDHRDPDAHTLDDMRESMAEEDLPSPMDVPLELFRTATDPDKFREIYTSAADAAKRMPKLKRLDIEFDIQGETAFGPGEHELRFIQGNERWCSASTAGLKVGWGLQPMVAIDPDVVKAWGDVGKVRNETVGFLIRDESCSDYDDFRLLDV